jgi:hypothetical protein
VRIQTTSDDRIISSRQSTRNFLFSNGKWLDLDSLESRGGGFNTATQDGSKISPSDAANCPGVACQGYSVSLSSDATTMAVGAKCDGPAMMTMKQETQTATTFLTTGLFTTQNFVNVGSVWIFVRASSALGSAYTPGTYTVTVASGTGFAIGQMIKISNGTNQETRQLTNVSGNTLTWDVSQGALTFSYASGTVYGAWTQQGSKISNPADATVGYINFGSSVCLSDNGNILAVGAPGDNNSEGAVFIYTRSVGVWTQQGPKLTCPDVNVTGQVTSTSSLTPNMFMANFGEKVCLSGDGVMLAVSAINDNGFGSVTLFEKISNVWTYHYPKFIGSTVSTFFGSGMHLSKDGKALVATDINTTITNSLKVYLRGDGALASGYTAGTGKTLATTSSNIGLDGFVSGTIFKIRDLSTGVFELRLVGTTSATGILAFEPEPLTNSYSTGAVITVWNLTSPLLVQTSSLNTAAISNNGDVVVIGCCNGTQTNIGFNSGLCYTLAKNHTSATAFAVSYVTVPVHGDPTTNNTTLTAYDNVQGVNRFGHAVSLNSTASTLAVSAVATDANRGAVSMFSNVATTLSAGVSAAATSITVVSASGFSLTSLPFNVFPFQKTGFKKCAPSRPFQGPLFLFRVGS